MTRLLKFRAWDEANKVMHYDVNFIRSGLDGNDWIVFTSNRQKLIDSPHPFENPYLQQQIKIMQWTGEYDINNVPIHEGDILSGEYPYDKGYYGVIEVCEEGVQNFFMTMVKRPNSECRGISDGVSMLFENDGLYKVEGNIYEDSYLIGK